MFLRFSVGPTSSESEEETAPDEGPGDSDTKPNRQGDKSPRAGGDAFIIIAGIVGAVAIGTLGFFISWGIGGLFITILATVGGAIIGGTVGAWLGEKVETRVGRHSGGGDDSE